MKHFLGLSIGCLVVVCLLTTGCRGSKDSHSDAKGDGMELKVDSTTLPDSVQSEMALVLEREAVLDRVAMIYRMVKQETLWMGGSVDNDLLDKNFCTKSWNNLLMAVRRKEHETNSLFFEVNHWTMMYESDLIDFDEFEIKDFSITQGDKRSASVTFTVYTSNTYTPARVDLVYEDGQWKIDNFHQLKYMMNMRACMWQYLDNDIMLYLL